MIRDHALFLEKIVWHQQQKGAVEIIPIIGKFSYDFASDQSTVTTIQQKLLGLNSEIVSFSDVLKIIDVKSKTQFLEQSLGNVSPLNKTIQTSPIQLENGNVVTEVYNFSSHGIEGETKLLMVA